MEVKRFDSSEGNVWKYVFDFGDAIAEAVLYKYESFNKRTVLCVSVQSGCPVGCSFCGTGKNFIRNLESYEIIKQVEYCLMDMGIEGINHTSEKFQIMFMSMGEPILNIENVDLAVRFLNYTYSNADLLISTVGIGDHDALFELLNLSEDIKKVGLQFSVHEAFDHKRDKLIPFRNKLSLRQLRDYGIQWNKVTSRPVFINYCVRDDNQSEEEMSRLMDLFPAGIFNFTFSVVCSADENMKEKGYRDLDKIKILSSSFSQRGYNVRIFDPAGQDDIGGGCGQLWYVQDWIKNKKRQKYEKRRHES